MISNINIAKSKERVFTPVVVNPPSFTLTETRRTSAGVFQGDKLIRTLWNGVSKGKGEHAIEWDGKDDFGNAVSGNYDIRVMTNKIVYTWEGTFGNTSDAMTGVEKFTSIDPVVSITTAQNKLFYAAGYSEGYVSMGSFAFNAPQKYIDAIEPLGSSSVNPDFVDSDGDLVYWFGSDPYYENGNSFVVATDAIRGSLVTFQYGQAYDLVVGVEFPSAIGYTDLHTPSGLSVQKTGDFLFLSVKTANTIKVLNKNTGELLQTLPFTSPSCTATDGSDLWVCHSGNIVEKYPVNGDGTLGVAGTSISGLSVPVEMRVNGTTLAIVDAGTDQQVKAFSTSTGASLWTLGTLGGNKATPVVQNDRFLFQKRNDSQIEAIPFGSITFETDGSFWVADTGNYRIQHFTADRVYIETVSWLGREYSLHVNHNDTSRIIYGHLEFEVNHALPVKDCAVLKYNWGANWTTANYEKSKTSYFSTFPNGRTYCIVIRPNPIFVEIGELDPVEGVRLSGTTFSNGGNYVLYPDYSLRMVTGTNTDNVYKKHEFLGTYDVNGFPEFGPETVVLTVPRPTDEYPRHGSPFGQMPWEITSTGVLACFDGTLNSIQRFKLGGIKDGEYKFLTSHTTPLEYRGDFPPDGSFDLGNHPFTDTGRRGFAANRVMAKGRHIIYGYHGEFWKQSQTNKFNHFYDNGLFVGQIGTTKQDPGVKGVKAATGDAGNAMTPLLVELDTDTMLLYHGEEHTHSGVHRWRIEGLSTISEQTIPISR